MKGESKKRKCISFHEDCVDILFELASLFSFCCGRLQQQSSDDLICPADWETLFLLSDSFGYRYYANPSIPDDYVIVLGDVLEKNRCHVVPDGHAEEKHFKETFQEEGKC